MSRNCCSCAALSSAFMAPLSSTSGHHSRGTSYSTRRLARTAERLQRRLAGVDVEQSDAERREHLLQIQMPCDKALPMLFARRAAAAVKHEALRAVGDGIQRRRRQLGFERVEHKQRIHFAMPRQREQLLAYLRMFGADEIAYQIDRAARPRDAAQIDERGQQRLFGARQLRVALQSMVELVQQLQPVQRRLARAPGAQLAVLA